jgi:hypothetical protein
MVIVSVNFKLSNDVSRSDLKSKFLETAPMYQTTAGLIRKNYLYDEERHVGGGIYLFDSMANAKSWFDEERIAWLAERYSDPVIHFFDSPVVVDNVTQEIVVED